MSPQAASRRLPLSFWKERGKENSGFLCSVKESLSKKPAMCKTKENCKLDIHRGCYGKVAKLILFAAPACRYDKVAVLTALKAVIISMPDGLRTFPLTNGYSRAAGAKVCVYAGGLRPLKITSVIFLLPPLGAFIIDSKPPSTSSDNK